MRHLELGDKLELFIDWLESNRRPILFGIVWGLVVGLCL